MDVRSRVVAGVAILHVEGPLVTGARSVPSLCATVPNQLRHGRLVVLINLAGVTDIDAGGIGWLVSSLTALERHGGRVAMVAPPVRVRQMLAFTKLDTVFAIYDSERDAFIKNRPKVVPIASSCLQRKPGWGSRLAIHERPQPQTATVR
jgi:anti-anti-sigma factor